MLKTIKLDDAQSTIAAGLIGAALLFFNGWQFHTAGAVWVSMILLVRSCRTNDSRYRIFLLMVFTILARYLSINGGWDMPVVANLGVSVLVLLPLWISLLVDRWYARRGKKLGSLLMFPLVYTASDFLLGFSPIGTVFSPSAGLFSWPALVQTVSLTGLGGLTFLIMLTATVLNVAWEQGFNLGQTRRPVQILMAIFVVLLGYGYGRPLLHTPSEESVRIAGITEAHQSNYWEITDADTPRLSKAVWAPEFESMTDRLFAQSTRAVQGGAKIIFWSEGNAVMYEDDEAAFLSRASKFAREHQVYLAPATLVLRYDRTKNDNLVHLFGPDGSQLFRYEKSISWYPTDSDGVVPVVQTPWGKLSAVICFDLDFPRLVRQAYKKDVDILLVPGFDTEFISPYHTQIGLLRGVEYGFSVVRMANKSTSMAADYFGNVLARQNYFTTNDRVMFADIPVSGIGTIYGKFGDWFIAAVWLSLVVGVLHTWRSRHNGPQKTEHDS